MTTLDEYFCGLYAVGDVDDEVRGWVRDAWGAAGLAKDEAPTGFLPDISG
jgi:hypothetical protein